MSSWVVGGVAVMCYGLLTQRSRARVPPRPLLSNNFEHIIYTTGVQANSVFQPSGVGK